MSTSTGRKLIRQVLEGKQTYGTQEWNNYIANIGIVTAGEGVSLSNINRLLNNVDVYVDTLENLFELQRLTRVELGISSQQLREERQRAKEMFDRFHSARKERYF